jgi:hypothetical protein
VFLVSPGQASDQSIRQSVRPIRKR